jgi:hypothetical protein
MTTAKWTSIQYRSATRITLSCSKIKWKRVFACVGWRSPENSTSMCLGDLHLVFVKEKKPPKTGTNHGSNWIRPCDIFGMFLYNFEMLVIFCIKSFWWWSIFLKNFLFSICVDLYQKKFIYWACTFAITCKEQARFVPSVDNCFIH